MWVTLHSNRGCACPETGEVVYCLFVHVNDPFNCMRPEWELIVTPPNCMEVCITAHTIAAHPQVLGSGSLVGSVVGTFIATTLLYTVILLVSICVLIYWNKRHR